MPIETDTGNIDFTWKFSPLEGQKDISYNLRLHKTSNYGWTISFLNPDNKPEFSFPAIMFREVNSHIGQYIDTGNRTHPPGGLSGSKTVSSVLDAPILSMPNIRDTTHSRGHVIPPAPKMPISVEEAVLVEGRKFDISPMNINKSDKIEEEIFLPSGHSVDDVMEFLGKDVHSFESFSSPDIPDTSEKTLDMISDSERKEILQERQVASNKVNANKGIKRI